jgi:hypothetical protein
LWGNEGGLVAGGRSFSLVSAVDSYAWLGLE